MHEDIAIVGMAGRFPGASSPDLLWSAVEQRRELLSALTVDETHTAGVGPEVTDLRNYVPRAGVLDGVELFDSGFFGIGKREADLLDPQQRVLLECCWEALESGGCPPDSFPGDVGVFVGVGASSYLLLEGNESPFNLGRAEDTLRLITSDKDFAATRISHRLNLRGPAITAQSACSTSLVNVHLAVQSLLHGDSDAVLAGGASVRVPHRVGYLHEPGGILSPDGRCRPFSAEASGTVPSSGAGVVLLKRVSDAVADRDHIHAVIKGSAVNNDGGGKLSYTAPAIDGQVKVITAAHERAGVEPTGVGYVETHGTATPLGDSMELAALRRALRTESVPGETWPLGTLKANIGHLDVAAGVAGLIKTALSLRHRTIPPALCTEPNEELSEDDGPFRLPGTAEQWSSPGHPRRAAVSSFGIGGTNAHVVLEQAPELEDEERSRPHQPLLLSARDRASLSRLGTHTAEVLPDVSLPSAGRTLLTGRGEFTQRWSTVADDVSEARGALRRIEDRNQRSATPNPGTAFLLPGPGSLRAGMTSELCAHEPVFRTELDRCRRILLPVLGKDLGELLHPVPGAPAGSHEELRRTSLAMPAVFAVEYALTELLAHWGVVPDALLGHSLGECVAACVSGVLGLRDGLRLAARRGSLLDSLPPGAMLSVAMSGAELHGRLNRNTTVAAEIGPDRSLVSGPEDDVRELREELETGGTGCQIVPVRYAGHSAELDPILEEFGDFVGTLDLSPPRVPYLSNVTGTWVTAEEATDPEHWVRQLRMTVRLDEDLAALASTDHSLLLEVGPGRTMGSWASRHPATASTSRVLPTLGGAEEATPPYRRLLESVGKLWEHGVNVNRATLQQEHGASKVPLPPHPFERTVHWVGRSSEHAAARTAPPRSTEAELARPDSEDAPARLVRIWERVLDVSGISPEDDFFALGGDSLMAVQLSSAVNEELGTEIRPQDMLRTPTPRGLSAEMAKSPREKPCSSPGHLTTLHDHPEPRSLPCPPLYLVHPIGGGTLVYRELSECLRSSCSVRGFTARGFHGSDATPRSGIVDMAHAYAEELVDELSGSEFCLGGSSFGGVVAFEMARVLERGGTPPALTVLIDSPWPPDVPLEETDTHTGLPGEQEAPSEVREGLYRLHRHHTTALHEYEPSESPTHQGRLLYVRATEEAAKEHERPELSWRTVAPTMRIANSPGDHYSMLRSPHVEELARLLVEHMPRGTET
ncbi:acyl transferase domain-containing protein/thioesterase domain-containing protein [Actinopolyspora biskrensis]|uniref:Acyl transferase domain-containing protein/thioesterase domain-containing protein n=1 Tax=Actinopolyspora biskrensis TaxID=1470178 RepID=A0A852Z3W7_9ACTN|nr:type I polyketide synthase [Actinopolyspora biskrensis]NYH78306.1 acyl transferase domain-containing protein/thioesterase domain-containing protein [Actinopolyspora biskrensis]